MILRSLLMAFPIMTIPPRAEVELIATAQRPLFPRRIQVSTYRNPVCGVVLGVEVRRTYGEAQGGGAYGRRHRTTLETIGDPEEPELFPDHAVHQAKIRLALDHAPVPLLFPGDEIVCLVLNDSDEPLQVTGICECEAEDK